MTKIRCALALGFIISGSPAFADEMLAVTPSGAAEMIFSKGRADTISAISNKCIDTHWTVVSSGNAEVTCESPLNTGQSVLGQVLMGNSYSTPPRRFFQFNVVEIGGMSRVQASGWVELQMAFGQTRRTDFSGPEFQNNILNFLAAAGGQYPPGTTFPHHAILGIKPQNVQMGAYLGLKIEEVQPASPAEKAGLQKGDVVTAIAGKRFKNFNDYLDATAQAAKNPTYKVDYLRDDKRMTASVERQFRPPVSESALSRPTLSNSAPETPAQVNTPVSSVADELGKLAKLKDAGVLTDAEFQAQKSKLLGQ